MLEGIDVAHLLDRWRHADRVPRSTTGFHLEGGYNSAVLERVIEGLTRC